MLSLEENELLTNTDPGTPMGELFRRFWIPVALSEEVPGPDSDPVRIKILGEDLIVFKDSEGRVGLVDAYCPHRGAPMFFGRNEESGLRCVYHGWKFDVDGACTDLPNAPEGETFKNKVKIAAYPCVEGGGLILAFMGPKDKQPPVPDFEWLDLPPSHFYTKKFRLECNWLQAQEGDFDPSHVRFLHSTLDNNSSNPGNRVSGLNLGIASGREYYGYYSMEETDTGMLFSSVQEMSSGKISVSVLPWMMPAFCVPGTAGLQMFSSNMRIPIDNTSMMFFRLRWSREPIPENELREYKQGGYVFPEMIPGTWKTAANVFNSYQIDRVAQRNYNYTGIKAFPLQDIAMMEDQWGPLADRRKEHLTSADEGIIRIRRRLIRTVRNLMEGIEPQEPWHPEGFRANRARMVLPAGSNILEAVAKAKAAALSRTVPSGMLIV